MRRSSETINHQEHEGHQENRKKGKSLTAKDAKKRQGWVKDEKAREVD
jgi:hypothetical protein